MTTPVTKGNGGHIQITSKVKLSQTSTYDSKVRVWHVQNSGNGFGPHVGTLELLIGWLTCSLKDLSFSSVFCKILILFLKVAGEQPFLKAAWMMGMTWNWE